MTPTSEGRMRRHLDNLAAAKDATPEERHQILESVRHKARDERRVRPLPRWLAGSANRRAIALLAAVPFAAGTVSAYMEADSPATLSVQAVGAVGLLAGIFTLRRASRELTEVPATDLDERELRERDQSIGPAYLSLLACLAIVALLALADGTLLDLTAWKPLVFGTLGTAVLLPSASATWKWRDLDEET